MKPNWKPLEEKLGKKRCVGFMFMGRINGINFYKHDMARVYSNLGPSRLQRGNPPRSRFGLKREIPPSIVCFPTIGHGFRTSPLF